MDLLAGMLQALSKKINTFDCFSTAQMISERLLEFRSVSAPVSRDDAANNAVGLKEMCFSELFPAADNVGECSRPALMRGGVRGSVFL